MELVIILVLALILFGPGKLPEVGKALGRSIREFKKATSGVEEGLQKIDAPQPSSPDQGGKRPAAETGPEETAKG